MFALSRANWFFSTLDQSKFPSLAAPIHSATDFLDALKSELIEDITRRTPVAALNYNLLLRTVFLIYCELDKVTKDMLAAKAILNELLDGPKIAVPNMDEKILTRAFCSPTVTIQDMRNERLDSPIPARMGSHLSKMWEKLGPELERSRVYGKEVEKIPEHVSVSVKGRASAEATQGREFLRGKKMQELKGVSRQMYEGLMAATAGMRFGSCADCEHCRNEVKIHNTDE